MAALARLFPSTWDANLACRLVAIFPAPSIFSKLGQDSIASSCRQFLATRTFSCIRQPTERASPLLRRAAGMRRGEIGWLISGGVEQFSHLAGHGLGRKGLLDEGAPLGQGLTAHGRFLGITGHKEAF